MERDDVVVPWAPGRVTPLAPAPPSDVDAVLDELFGEPDTGGPGWFDVVLLVAGAVLVARRAYAVGAVALVLGLALPVRSLVRRAQRRVRHRRYAALLAGGQPLAAGHPETDALLAAYDAVLDAARGSWADDAVAAAHRAVVECASLLGGEPPSTPEESAYVARRTTAIRDLAAALAAAPDRDRVAAVRAREEIDAISGRTSLHDLRDATAYAGGAR